MSDGQHNGAVSLLSSHVLRFYCLLAENLIMYTRYEMQRSTSVTISSSLLRDRTPKDSFRGSGSPYTACSGITHFLFQVLQKYIESICVNNSSWKRPLPRSVCVCSVPLRVDYPWCILSSLFTLWSCSELLHLLRRLFVLPKNKKNCIIQRTESRGSQSQWTPLRTNKAELICFCWRLKDRDALTSVLSLSLSFYLSLSLATEKREGGDPVEADELFPEMEEEVLQTQREDPLLRQRLQGTGELRRIQPLFPFLLFSVI